MSEVISQVTTSATLRRNFWRAVWRVLLRKPSRLAGLIMLGLFVLMGAFGPMFYPSPLPRDPGDILASPS